MYITMLDKYNDDNSNSDSPQYYHTPSSLFSIIVYIRNGTFVKHRLSCPWGFRKCPWK